MKEKEGHLSLPSNLAQLKKATCTLLASVLIVSASLSMPAYGAADTTDLEQQRSEIDERITDAKAEIDRLAQGNAGTEEQLAALTKKMDAIQQKIDTLEEEIAQTQAKVDGLQKQIQENEAEIVDMERQIAEQKKLFEVKKEQYNERLRVLYMSGHVTNLEALLGSADIGTLLTRAELISSVSKKDQKALNELTDSMASIKEKQAALEQSKKLLEEDKVEILTSKAELDDRLADMENEKAELAADKKKSQATMAVYQGQVNNLNGFIRTSESEQKIIDQEIADKIRKAEEELIENGNSSGGGSGGGSGGSSGDSGGGSGGDSGGGNSDGFDYSYIGTGVYVGRFVHPVPKRKYISVGYPYYSDGTWHGGIDFGCWNEFPPIYAADTGIVFIVEDLGKKSYGKYVVIRHEKGLYTLYGHCNAIYVSKGQTVNRGQNIAQVGTTGKSTGNHLHFEVRLGDEGGNRNVDNPARYFKDSGF